MKVDIYVKILLRKNFAEGGNGVALIEYVPSDEKPVTRIVTESFFLGTNNSIELEMCNKALKKLIKPCTVTIHTSNRYIKSAMINDWPKQWRDKGWKKATGKPPANIQEWKQLLMLCEIHKVSWKEYDTKYDKELTEALEKERESHG